MKLRQLTAHNFKLFSDLDLELNGKNTVIFGVNGTGKSTILSIIIYLFRIWINRINPAQGRAYESLNDDIIKMHANECDFEAQIEMDDREYILRRQYQKRRPGTMTKPLTYDKKMYEIFCNDFVQEFLQPEENNMPIFVNYGTNRSVLDIPLRIRNKHQFGMISALERAVENELDFRTFFEWFRNQEDLENETKLDKGNPQYEDIMLKCVRRAVEAMLGNVSDLRVRRDPLRMVVKKSNEDIRVDQLSDGEKCTLALFGDLARRIAIANQYRENPLEGEGIVLIDEIELHMHPTWQRRVLDVLTRVFPNIQFIVTTHSPQVLGEADDSYNIFLLKSTENGGTAERLSRMDGLDSNYILEEYMGTDSKNLKVKGLIKDINRHIALKQFDMAEKKLEELKKISGNMNEDVILAQGFLNRSRGNK